VWDPNGVWTVAPEPVESEDSVRLLRAFFQELIDRYHGHPMPESDVDVEMGIDPSTGFAAFFVARWDGAPAGCLGLRESGALTRMYVRPEYRGRGAGRRLLAAIEVRARELGIERIQIDTRDDLVEARRLYVACGYDEVPAFNAAPYAEHWYEKRL
jgi:GNAT superfamily N-acetyltransferase